MADEIPFQQPEKSEVRESKDEQKQPKKAFIERAMYTYLKSFFSQGYKKLIEKQYRYFFVYVMVMIAGSTIMNMLFALEIITDIAWIQHVILLCLLTGIALIIGGLIGGFTKMPRIQSIFTLLLIIVIFGIDILLYFLNYSIDLTGIWIEIIKLTVFISYVCIGSISFFFIIISFITAISYRLLNLGNSPDRLLFQGILRLAMWISIPMFGYLIFQGGLDALLLGIGGISIAGGILYNIYHLPKTAVAENFTEKVDVKAKINYFQVVGFYYLYLIYHLSQSFNDNGEIANLAVNFILLAINTIFMINTLSKKVDSIQELDDLQRSFMFQRKTGFSAKIKDFIGERGLVLIMLGIALGFYGVYLDSYLGNQLQLIIYISDVAPALNVTYHRTFLGIGLLVIFFSFFVFLKSPKFQQIFVNRYTFRHVIRMFGDLFRINEDGTTGQILKTYIQSKEKVNTGIDQVKKGLKRSWDSLFTLGKQKIRDNDSDTREEDNKRDSNK